MPRIGCVIGPRAGYCNVMLADVSEVSMDGPTTRSRLAPGWEHAVERAEPWLPADDPVLVVVPHHDDESLMFGGLLARCAALGTRVHVLAVTGGAACPEGVDSRPSARLRRIAQREALEELGLTEATVTRLGITDGTVADHEDELVDAITALVEDRSIGSVLTPWENDHHTDHEACGRAVRRARSAGISGCSVVSGVFWPMLREPAPPGLTLAALVLTSEEMTRKSAAIRRHRSNFASVVCDAPLLGENDLAPTRWRREHLIVDPAA